MTKEELRKYAEEMEKKAHDWSLSSSQRWQYFQEYLRARQSLAAN